MTSKTKKSEKQNFQNESYQFTLVNPKRLLRLHTDPKNTLIGLKKAQNDLKKQKNKKSQKTNNTYKMKVINHKKSVKLTSKES